MPFYDRWQTKTITKALTTRRVLLLEGPRQCGKTTLAKAIGKKQTIYRTLDDSTLLEAAEADPHQFIQSAQPLMIIDEVQRAPNLLLAIKKQVDEDTRNGQYLLTGSANIQSLPSVKESLAGRIKKIRLRPLSQGEILGQAPEFLETAFNLNTMGGPINQPITWKSFDKREILVMAFQGGFPEAIKLNAREQKNWHRDYIQSLLDRDLQEIAQIRRREDMQQVIHILAAWSSQLMDITGICNGLSITRPTLESYMNALEAMYLVERVPAWIKNDYDRVGKRPKLFWNDGGQMSAILGWKPDALQLDPKALGKLMETFVFNELAAQIDASLDQQYQLFHFRDRENREIDFLIERDDGALLGIEVKAGAVNSRDFKHLRWFQTHLAKQNAFTGIILYTGENLLSFGENLWAVPMSFLWLNQKQVAVPGHFPD